MLRFSRPDCNRVEISVRPKCFQAKINHVWRPDRDPPCGTLLF
jgi:hypothetical protein